MMTKDELELLKNSSKQDQSIAEKTWRDNHIEVHESGFKRSSEKLKNAVRQSFNPAPEPFDTDLGYGAGQLFIPSDAEHQIESFKQLMREMRPNDKER